jgi:formate dehydrogenase iron-sulfur subunit
MAKAMLIDTTRCIGCRSCQVSCKAWNELGASRAAFSDTGSHPRHLDANNFTRVVFRELPGEGGRVRSVFVKRQCMHCLEPACEAACPVGALAKTKEGPVVYDDARCIGCRYCMVACPFNVPKFQWEAWAPYVKKCTFCADRQAAGMKPACASTCPTEAIAFGERADLVAEAHRRLAASPGRYAPGVYGERTGGGTSVLYLTAVTIEVLGLAAEGFRTDLGDLPQGRATREWMANVPWFAATIGGLALGLYQFNQRAAAVKGEERKEGKQP